MNNVKNVKTEKSLFDFSESLNLRQLMFSTTLLVIFLVFSANAQNQNLNAEQKTKIKTILSSYNSSSLTAEQAKEIHEKFRSAGIHAGPETKEAIIAAGFDPEKLKTLAPPPAGAKANTQKPDVSEARTKIVEERIIAPLAINAVQSIAIKTAFSEFYDETDKLKKAQPEKGVHIDKSLMEPLEKVRNEKIKKVLSDELFRKFLELEKSSRPPKPDDKKNQLKK